MLSSAGLAYATYVIMHNTTTDHHHGVQVVQVQVFVVLRQWPDEKALPLPVGEDIARKIAFDFIGNRKPTRFSQPQALPPSWRVMNNPFLLYTTP